MITADRRANPGTARAYSPFTFSRVLFSSINSRIWSAMPRSFSHCS